VLIQREAPEHVDAIRAVTAAAFARTDQSDPSVEARLVDELRACEGWLPALSLVALGGAGEVIGHIVCTRARVGSALALGLGPLSVHPDHQRRGVGSALVHAVLGAADALGEPVVVLLGSPAYYSRFGFVLAEEIGISPPDPAWRPHFQARTLAAFTPALRGRFAYAEPFSRV
jgi:putative acetyltransferase